MCINSVAISVVSSAHFSLIFSYAIAASYYSKLRLFLVVNEISGINILLHGIMCTRPLI